VKSQKPASAAKHCIAPLSVNGNPTPKTLLAVLKAVGMKLSVEPEERARGVKKYFDAELRRLTIISTCLLCKYHF
jgi:hypothetical protein